MATATVNKAAQEVLQIDPQVTQLIRVQNIRVSSVRVGKRMRSLGDVNALIASIRELGLLNRHHAPGSHRESRFHGSTRTLYPVSLGFVLIDDLFLGNFPGGGSACNHAVAWLT
jgi:hypothetical protein